MGGVMHSAAVRIADQGCCGLYHYYVIAVACMLQGVTTPQEMHSRTLLAAGDPSVSALISRASQDLQMLNLEAVTASRHTQTTAEAVQVAAWTQCSLAWHLEEDAAQALAAATVMLIERAGLLSSRRDCS